MRLAIWILRLGMHRQKAEALAGDLCEDLGRRWRSAPLRAGLLLLFAAGYALLAVGARAMRLFQPIDARLAFRMLRKYPGLTAIATFSLAVAIAIGAGTFAVRSLLFPTLPLDDGDRVVSIMNRSVDTRYRHGERRVLFDFAIWRAELGTLTDIGAFLTTRRNLIAQEGTVEPVPLAQMSAAGFRIARVAPLMGRWLEDRDERPDAEDVMVIGESLWRRVFHADPSVVGRTARLGNTVHTIVGVMPAGFAFPINNNLWVPFRVDPNAFPRGEGPEIGVFARLAPGIERGAAEAEIAALGERLARQFPESNQQLRPRIVPYTSVFADFDEIEHLYVLQATVVLLLVVIAINVAILLYARTVTRAAEIAVRTALGASRWRILMQLFIEAATLAAVAGLAGLLMLTIAFVQLESALHAFLPDGPPFWMDLSISPRIVIDAALLSLLGAGIAGVAPALRMTGRRVQNGLQHLATRGAGLRLGPGWTALVIGQVAITAALLPAAAVMAFSSLKFADADPGFPARNYLVAEMGLDPDQQGHAPAAGSEHVARFHARQAELRRQLASEPGVTSVTNLWTVPGREPNMKIELDGADGGAPVEIRFNRVDADYFSAFGASVLSGRTFGPADAGKVSTAVIVNQHFVDRILQGASPLGRRIRYVSNQGAGRPAMAQDGTELPGVYEVVGVVGNIPGHELSGSLTGARVYHPRALERVSPTLAIGVSPERAPAIVPRVRHLAVAIDPAFRVNRIIPLMDVYEDDKTEERWGAVLLAAITLAVLVLAGGGVYSLMSVTVSRKRREIGIRTALGGDPRRILAAVFGRAFGLLAAGALLGMIPALVLVPVGEMVAGPVSAWEIGALYAAVAIFLPAAGLIAAYGPARRGLRIEPAEALRAE